MRRDLACPPLHLLLLGMLAACGGALDSNLTPESEESLGTIESALCSGTTVSTLSISGISTYQGEMGGMGPWAVAGGANAVHLEYYIDGVLATSEERCEANSSGQCTGSGTWYFSKSNVACGSRTFLLKAWPMVIDSANNRTICWGTPRTVSQTVTEECPPPPVCNGTAGQWSGCRGNGCAVCAEKLTNYPCYFQNHPSCVRNDTCAGLFYTCNEACPAPTAADTCSTCNGTAGQWSGCRGNGCAVCAEKLTNYPCYFQNHPGCVRNDTCAGLFYTCNASCPAPTAADACQSILSGTEF